MALFCKFKYPIFALLATCSLTALDTAHFYRATPFYQEPRLEKPWLTTIQANFSGGSTTDGRNGCGHQVPLFDIYGPHNMQHLGAGVHKEFGNPYDILLTMLEQLPANGNFGHLSIDGKFRIAEFNIALFQNLSHGFFIHESLPLRTIDVCDLSFCDLSPATGTPNKNTLEWQLFLDNFDAILAHHGLYARPFCTSGIGDFSFLLGWTTNYEKTKVLDFIDATLQTGVLIPTGKKKNQCELFSFSLGYNGHYGLPVIADIAFGIYDWLTLGAHLDALIFASRSYPIRIKTDPKQSGIIQLALAKTRVKPGHICSLGCHLKADHVIRGLSLLLGYSFAYKGNDSLCQNRVSLPNQAINSNEIHSSWQMHTIHLQAEYDFSKPERFFGPRIAFFCDIPVSGKHIFKTIMGGGYFGLDIAVEV